MLGPAEFRDLVSGRRRGINATALRGLLRVAEIPYSLAVRFRNHRYDRGRTAIHNVSVPVISVGNLSLGGTGKTPMVKWLARRLHELGTSVALVSRGYGADADNLNDEARELAQALPHVPHLQNSNRVVAARRAIDEFAPNVLLLDDGFQHRRLARDLDIVLLDALEPFGFDHVFPRGTLREPLAGLERADVVCLSRADAVAPKARESIRRRVAELAPHAAWCELAHAANGLVNTAGATESLEYLSGKRVAAFCAIGNPAGFRHTLSTTGCEIAMWREFSDHHLYSAVELDSLAKEAGAHNADLIVCTQKDLVKAPREKLGSVPLWAVAIDIQFLAGREALEQILEQAVRKK
jgi:tetraacyldisaccharide 4'-kinase